MLLTHLCKMFIISWFYFDGSYVSRNISISFIFSNLLELQIFLLCPNNHQNLLVCCSVSFSFVVLFIWYSFLFLLVSFTKGLQILIMSKKKLTLCSIDFFFVSFQLTNFCPDHYSFFVSLICGLVCPCFIKILMYIIKLVIWDNWSL